MCLKIKDLDNNMNKNKQNRRVNDMAIDGKIENKELLNLLSKKKVFK